MNFSAKLMLIVLLEDKIPSWVLEQAIKHQIKNSFS